MLRHFVTSELNSHAALEHADLDENHNRKGSLGTMHIDFVFSINGSNPE